MKPDISNFDGTELTDSVISGDFGPISALAHIKAIDTATLNSLIFDKTQRAGLVHYLGHFGSIQALRYFTELGLDLNQEDAFNQTIVHYACRQGRLGILKHLYKDENLRKQFHAPN